VIFFGELKNKIKCPSFIQKIGVDLDVKNLKKKEQLNFVKLFFKCDVNLLLIFGLEVFFHKYIHFYVIKNMDASYT
jgi:hypothetical protein